MTQSPLLSRSTGGAGARVCVAARYAPDELGGVLVEAVLVEQLLHGQPRQGVPWGHWGGGAAGEQARQA